LYCFMFVFCTCIALWLCFVSLYRGVCICTYMYLVWLFSRLAVTNWFLVLTGTCHSWICVAHLTLEVKEFRSHFVARQRSRFDPRQGRTLYIWMYTFSVWALLSGYVRYTKVLISFNLLWVLTAWLLLSRFVDF
jgi:hypothetical protein